jgi:hypothetical protein
MRRYNSHLKFRRSLQQLAAKEQQQQQGLQQVAVSGSAGQGCGGSSRVGSNPDMVKFIVAKEALGVRQGWEAVR